MATRTILETYASNMQQNMDDNEMKESESNELLQSMHTMCETAAK